MAATFQNWPQNLFEGIGLPYETKIGWVGTINRSLAVVAQQMFACQIMEIPHAGRRQRFIHLLQCLAAIEVAFSFAGDEKRIGESSLEMRKVEPKKPTIVIRKKKT